MLMANDFRAPTVRPYRRDETVEPGRLGRAIKRKYDKIGPRQYIVEGRHEKYYYVDLSLDRPCGCKDAEIRGVMCLHELKARIVEQEPAVFAHVLALAERTVEAERENARAAKRAARRSARPTRARRTRAVAEATE